MSTMTALALAVGGTALICYLLMTRLQNRGVHRRSSRNGAGSDVTSYVGDDGGSLPGWCGHSAADPGNPGEASGGESGGGGDGGGGDGGGGSD